MAKGFDHSAPIGPLTPGIPPALGAICLSVDGEPRQKGDLADMIWPVADIIGFLSTYVTLAAGDLIFTGTPAGVGPVQRGEKVRGEIAGLEPVEIMFEYRDSQ
jgi:fumarylpyruvate hydrolase